MGWGVGFFSGEGIILSFFVDGSIPLGSERTLRDKCCCSCEAGVSGTTMGMIAVLIQFTGFIILIALFYSGGRRSVSPAELRRLNGVAAWEVFSTWALFAVLVLLSVTHTRVMMDLPGNERPALALLRPMPWLNLPIRITNKPSTSLDLPTEPEKTKSSIVYPSPHHLDIFFDYEEGLAYSRRVEKPVLIHFTGHDCKESRDMEVRVWSDPDVLGYLHNEYVVIQLYVDDETPLPLRDHAISPHTGKAIGTLGHRWGDLQATRFGTDAQPYYVVLSPSGKELIPGTGAEYDIDRYAQFLAEGIKAFQSRSKSIL